jgi:hypothetical protein
MVDADAATLLDGRRLYVFSAKSGKWRGVDLETGKATD